MTLRHFVYCDLDGADDGKDLTDLLHLVSMGELHPEIGFIADWAKTAVTLQDMETRRLRGKAAFLL